MIETISEAQYRQEVAEQAGRLAEWVEQDIEHTAYESFDQAAPDLVTDLLDGHDWFARLHYGPAAYGCIIEHAEERGVALHRWGDISAYTDSDEPREILKRLAFAAFEADIIDSARERYEGSD